MESKKIFKKYYKNQFEANDEAMYFLCLRNGNYEWTSENKNDAVRKAFHNINNISNVQVTVDELVSKKVLFSEDTEDFKEILTAIAYKTHYIEQILRMNLDGKGMHWMKVSVMNSVSPEGMLEESHVSFIDNERVITRFAEVLHRFEYDDLTGIYNEEKFYALVQDAIRTNTDKSYALIRMDINSFKVINDMFGLEVGNKILLYMTKLIKECYQPGFFYCRVNSDIFCICLPYETKQDILSCINYIEDNLEQFDLNYKLVPSFGIYRIEDRNIPISVMLDWAKLASKSVKGSTFSNYAFYNNTLRNKILQEAEIVGAMNKALHDRQFKVFLQPKYDILTSQIVGAEALCRWMDPKKGIVPPSSFIPLFEKNGFVIKLDYYMWEETFKLIRRWLDEGKNVFTISLNVSRMHVYNDEFEKQLLYLQKKYRVPANLIELELTETVFLENEEELYHIIEHLKSHGFLFSIDDFGTGYSSLNMLKNVPIDIVKLDRGFLNETSVSRKGKEIIRYIIAMARQLNLKVIAEGVETMDQAAFLLETGCDTAQGFYYCKPITIDEFEQIAFENNQAKANEKLREIFYCSSDAPDQAKAVKNYDILNDIFEDNFTYDEKYGMNNNYIQIMKKYRALIYASNLVFYEFNLELDKVMVSFHQKGFEPEKEIKKYKELKDFLLTHCNPEDKKKLADTISLQNLQNLLDERKTSTSLDCRIKRNGMDEIWIRIILIIDADMNGILDTLLLSCIDINDIKCHNS